MVAEDRAKMQMQRHGERVTFSLPLWPMALGAALRVPVTSTKRVHLVNLLFLKVLTSMRPFKSPRSSSFFAIVTSLLIALGAAWLLKDRDRGENSRYFNQKETPRQNELTSAYATPPLHISTHRSCVSFPLSALRATPLLL
jgi:hypothetical protein